MGKKGTYMARGAMAAKDGKTGTIGRGRIGAMGMGKGKIGEADRAPTAPTDASRTRKGTGCEKYTKCKPLKMLSNKHSPQQRRKWIGYADKPEYTRQTIGRQPNPQQPLHNYPYN